MSRTRFISNALLWASAIIASAIVGAPTVLSTILLPALATCALLMTWPSARPTQTEDTPAVRL
jgi:hypothetical protein